MSSLIDLGPLAFVWRGEWNNATTDYTVNSVVRHDSTLYIGVLNTIEANDIPGQSPAWDIFFEFAIPKIESPYELCEFYYFRNPDLRPGFRHAYGELLNDAATLYPLAWDFLQSPQGQALCISEDDWQAMSTATWHTLADGTEIGWEGVGGVPFYVVDTEAQTLRLPDLRGMYAEAAGFDSLGVGGVHGDGVREISGTVCVLKYGAWGGSSTPTGAFQWANVSEVSAGSSTSNSAKKIDFSASRVVPTANQNQPRAWGALPCVYLGS